MGKAYSVDLRVRVLAAIDGGLSKMQAHKTFQVRRSTIDDWLRLLRRLGACKIRPVSRVRGAAWHTNKAGRRLPSAISTAPWSRCVWPGSNKRSSVCVR